MNLGKKTYLKLVNRQIACLVCPVSYSVSKVSKVKSVVQAKWHNRPELITVSVA